MVRKTRTPTIKVDGTQVSDDFESMLARMEVRSAVNRAAVAELYFRDPYYTLVSKGTFKIGSELEVLLPDDGNVLKPVFEGEITGLGTRQPLERGAEARCYVAARSGSHRLAAAATYKAYLEQSRDDIVSEIAGRHGLTAECDPTGGPEPYLLQAGTDHAFLTWLARGVGFEWFVSGKKLHFCKRDAEAGPTLKRSDETLASFSAVYEGIHLPSEITVYGWDAAQQADFNGTAGNLLSKPPTAVLGSTAPLVTKGYDAAKGAFATPLLLGAPPALDASQADAIAEGVAFDLISGGLQVEGLAAADPAIKAGGVVTVEEVGAALSGDYYVTEVVHLIEARREAFTIFRCTPHAYEPPRLPTVGGGVDAWGSTGLVLGVVTNINDPEGLGRVKVRFPSLGADAESDWARIVIPGVGEDRGFDVRPEVNDEVVVGFERGDPRTAFVLGGVWSAKHKPPEADTSAETVVVRRQIVSRVGHAVTISDGPDGAGPGDAERYVEIALADDETVVKIAEDHILIEAAEGNELKIVSGDGSITLTDAGDVKIAANNITLEAKQKLSLKAGTDGDFKALNLKLEGKVGFEAAGTQVKVAAKAIAEVKGAMVKIN